MKTPEERAAEVVAVFNKMLDEGDGRGDMSCPAEEGLIAEMFRDAMREARGVEVGFVSGIDAALGLVTVTIRDLDDVAKFRVNAPFRLLEPME